MRCSATSAALPYDLHNTGTRALQGLASRTCNTEHRAAQRQYDVSRILSVTLSFCHPPRESKSVEAFNQQERKRPAQKNTRACEAHHLNQGQNCVDLARTQRTARARQPGSKAHTAGRLSSLTPSPGSPKSTEQYQLSQTSPFLSEFPSSCLMPAVSLLYIVRAEYSELE